MGAEGAAIDDPGKACEPNGTPTTLDASLRWHDVLFLYTFQTYSSRINNAFNIQPTLAHMHSKCRYSLI